MNLQNLSFTDLHDILTQWVMKRSLISLFIVVIAAQIIFSATTRYLEHRVGGVYKSLRILYADTLFEV